MKSLAKSIKCLYWQDETMCGAKAFLQGVDTIKVNSMIDLFVFGWRQSDKVICKKQQFHILAVLDLGIKVVLLSLLVNLY